MRIRIAIVTLVLGLLAPTVALGCSIVATPPLVPHISRADLRPGVSIERSRAAWRVAHPSWQTAQTTMNQQVRVPGTRRVVNAAFRQQTSLRLSSSWPERGAKVAGPAPGMTCDVPDGTSTWAKPRVLVRETDRAVFVTAITRQQVTREQAAGCGFVTMSCDDRVQHTIRLAAPIGDRTVYITRFAPAGAATPGAAA